MTSTRSTQRLHGSVISIARILCLALALVLVAAPAHAYVKAYHFTWFSEAEGRRPADGSAPPSGARNGYGLATVAAQANGQLVVRFSGPGGEGHADIYSPNGGNGFMTFPTVMAGVAGTSSTPAAFKWFGAFDAPDSFVLNGYSATQAGVYHFEGSAVEAWITAQISSPADRATVSGTVNVVMSAGGALPTVMLTLRLYIDGREVFSRAVNGQAATYAWNTAGAAAGAHELRVAVTDVAGGVITESIRTVSIGSGAAAPALAASFTSPAAGASVSGTIPVGMAVSGAPAGSKTFTLSVGGAQAYAGSTTGTALTHSLDTRTLPNGAHTLMLTVRDASGRTATATRAITVSNTASAATLSVIYTSPAAGATVRGVVWVDIWVEGGAGTSHTFTLSVAGRVVATQTLAGRHVTLSFDSRQFANGAHTMSATVTNNVTPTPNRGTATRAVTIAN